jgi:hypothetical protein
MRKLAAAVLALSLLSLTDLNAQDKRGPSTPEERARALAAIDDLETHPLGPNAKEERHWLTIWLIEVPDIHVGFCTDLLPDIPKKKDGEIIPIQMVYSSARYAIQHDGSSSTSIEQYEAGVEGALKVYEVLLQDHPKDRDPKLDDLIQRRTAGTLADYVKERAASACKK